MKKNCECEYGNFSVYPKTKIENIKMRHMKSDANTEHFIWPNKDFKQMSLSLIWIKAFLAYLEVSSHLIIHIF